MKISNERITGWVATASTKDDYPLKHPFAVLIPTIEFDSAIAKVAAGLGETGCRGLIYVEQMDVGNGLQDLGSPRVHINARNGEATSTPYSNAHLGSRLGVLATFPPEAN